MSSAARTHSGRLTWLAIAASIVAAIGMAPNAGAASPKRSGGSALAKREDRRAIVDRKRATTRGAKVVVKSKAPTRPKGRLGNGGTTNGSGTAPATTTAPENIESTPVVETEAVTTPTTRETTSETTSVSNTTPETPTITPSTTPETISTNPTPPDESTLATSEALAARLFTGATISDFPMNQSAPGAVTEVPNPTNPAEKAIQMTVANTDVYPLTPTDNPRAQLLSPAIIEQGEEFWWHSKFYLPADFPTSVPGWLTVLEGPYGAPYDGTPPWHIEVNGTGIRWQRNSEYTNDIPWEMPLVRGQWVEILMHCKFAAEGFVEMWVDGQQVTFFKNSIYNPAHVAPTTRLNMKTRDQSNDGGPNFAVIQSYRQVNMFNSVTLLQGPMLLGKTRASVEEP
jgi:Polysaccharide lyase